MIELLIEFESGAKTHLKPLNKAWNSTDWIDASGRFSWILISLQLKSIWIHPSRNHIRQSFLLFVPLWDFKVQLVEPYIHPLTVRHAHTHTHTMQPRLKRARQWGTSVLFLLWQLEMKGSPRRTAWSSWVSVWTWVSSEGHWYMCTSNIERAVCFCCCGLKCCVILRNEAD